MKYSPAVLPIPGATRTEGILDCVGATEIPLSDEDFKHINENLPEQAEHSSESLPKPAHRQIAQKLSSVSLRLKGDSEGVGNDYRLACRDWRFSPH
jgi:hypothetical protein